MDISQESDPKPQDEVPVLSSYAKSLESHVQERYLKKISVVGVDPAAIPSEQFSSECLPPIEVSDLLSYLVLETSYYTNQQFKAFKSLEAYNQMVSGFVASVQGKEIAGKIVVVAKVRHSQRMNDPLVNIWMIVEKDGTIISAHCLGCKAGLAESCSHVASAMFYIEAVTRIQGKLACTQAKCTWILPTYVTEVPYSKVRDIDFSSAKKLKSALEQKIEIFHSNTGEGGKTSEERCDQPSAPKSIPSDGEMQEVYAKLNSCKIKAVALSLIDPFADQFIDESRTLPIIPDLFKTENLGLDYPDLIKMCVQVNLGVTEEHINKVEVNTRDQASGSGFYRHRAGRIGASQCSSAFHTNLAQPSQSLIKTICYPSLYKVNTKATRYGQKHESDAIKAYEASMKERHVNLEVKKCGLFINKENSFLHATPDFLVSCDCCGSGCGEVKCPVVIIDGNFEDYVKHKNSCLERVNGNLELKKSHSYYYQVQQQLFSAPNLQYDDFVVCAIDKAKNIHLFVQRKYPDEQHWKFVVPKLETFWRICILPEIFARWYTRRCTVPPTLPSKDAICFCRTEKDEDSISCCNKDCPYQRFHPSCLSLTSVAMPKTWYCPHCCRLPQFKRKKSSRKSVQPTVVSDHAAMKCDSICICKAKPTPTDKLVECHGESCQNGKYFHLACLGLKRLPNNHRTTWKCPACKKVVPAQATTTPTTCSSSSDSSSSDDESDVVITKVTHSETDKTSALANLTDYHFDLIINPTGWLDCDIIQQAHVLLQPENPAIAGFQRPTLGPVRNFDVVSGEFIQILHTGNNHWVCTSSIGCVPGYVNLFDSLYHDSVVQEVEEQTNDLLGGRLIALDPKPVQQQTNGSDCGVFAVAFATCLVFGVDPTFINFDAQGMRHHLVTCLRNGRISLFPSF
ncbi:uncharacterized protein LOC144665209 [Oculina patagonica]